MSQNIKRKVITLISVFTFWIMSFAYLFLHQKLTTHTFEGALLLFFFLNVGYAFYHNKINLLLKIISAALVTAASLTVIFCIISFNLFPSGRDPYAIFTTIILNGIFSILIWEVILILINRFNVR